MHAQLIQIIFLTLKRSYSTLKCTDTAMEAIPRRVFTAARAHRTESDDVCGVMRVSDPDRRRRSIPAQFPGNGVSSLSPGASRVLKEAQ